MGTSIAATSLVGIVDPANEARQAHVTANGALKTSGWAGVPAGYVNAEAVRSGAGWLDLVTTTAGQRLAVTEMTFSTQAGASAAAYGDAALESFLIPASSSCTTLQGGAQVLRRLIIPMNSTLELNWNGPALQPLVAGAGQKACFGVQTLGPGKYLHVGLTGYKFTGS